MRIIDFEAETPIQWAIVNDGVMGGRSTSAMRREDGAAVFEGHVSLENRGGFASVRVPVAQGALTGAARVLARVRGDGKRYQLRLRHGRSATTVAYKAAFHAPAGKWTTVALSLDAFEPTFRGTRPRDAEPLDPARVGQVGIMLADGQEGPFRLEVRWIDAA